MKILEFTRRQGDIARALLLGSLLVLAYSLLAPGIGGPFVFDDFPNLQNLREVGDSFTRESIGRYLAAWQGNPGRPLAALSFLIEDHAWPTDPAAFKRNNLLWHLLVGLGIFALTRRLVRLALSHRAAPIDANYASAIAVDGSHTPVGAGHARDQDARTNHATAIAEDGGRGHGPLLQRPAENETAPLTQHPRSTLPDWIALAVLALWLVHPLQLSAAFLVVQRMTILANGLMVAGLLIYLRLICDSRAADLRTALLALAALGGFGALAFLAKENGPLIFVYATALNLTLLAPALARFDSGPRRLIWAGTLGMTVLLVAALLWQVRDPAAAYAMRDFTLGERLLSEARILWQYLQGILLPKLGSGGIYHDDFLVSRSVLQPWITLPAVTAWATALLFALVQPRRFPLASFAVLWFAAGHLIESTFIPLELYFEHRNYLAMLGPLLAVTTWLTMAGGDIKWPLRIALVLWIALTAGIGHQGARTWGDALGLAENWVKERPASVRAWQHLAVTYAGSGDYEFALSTLGNARKTIPEASEFAFQMAPLACASGYATAQSIDALIDEAKEARWASNVTDAVRALRYQMRNPMCSSALTPKRYRTLIATLLANPAYLRRAESVAHLNYELAWMHLDIGQPAQSLPAFAASFAAKPDPQVALNMAEVNLLLERPAEAMRALDLAENAQQPAFKQWLHDVTWQIPELRQAARLAEARLRYAQDIAPRE